MRTVDGAEVTTRQDLKRAYKEKKHPAGVFQVKCKQNGKVLLGSSLNLEGCLNRHRFELNMGSHRSKELQKDWKELGPDAFVFEILEEVKVRDVAHFDLADELTLLEQIWLDALKPFGERGYNIDSKIRQA
jgi:group I intron endonuclease